MGLPLISFTSIFAVLVLLVRAQDQSGFVSIDCGIPDDSSYNDESTDIKYVSDAAYVESGTIHSIDTQYQTSSLEKQFQNLRSFPDGKRNCYDVQPPRGKGFKYLIRTRFMYGNYDTLGKAPEFDLYLGVNIWDSVKIDNATMIITKEIIHTLRSDHVHVCLVDKNKGTPFLSVLELRLLKSDTYETPYDSLMLFKRWDLGGLGNAPVRYKDDVFDRIWIPLRFPKYTIFNASLIIDSNNDNGFKPARSVMNTATSPEDSIQDIILYWEPEDPTWKYYVYMHFAEVVELPSNETREFSVLLNKKSINMSDFSPRYLYTDTLFVQNPVSGPRLEFLLRRTDKSTLPPMINAIETYRVNEFLQSPTDQQDAQAIMMIKSKYGMKKNWLGDPCGPVNYPWKDINCSYVNNEPPRIVSLNLSFSGLTGEIDPTFSNLTSLKKLFFAVFVFLVHAQDQSGFVSIDCGIPDSSSYNDELTDIKYISDAAYVESGTVHSIDPEFETSSLEKQFQNVRSFHDGKRNCYDVQPPSGNGFKYMIRTRFMYGNYDKLGKAPEFDLYLGVNLRDSVTIDNATTIVTKEIIHTLRSDHVHVCLVDTDKGTPFLSVLELRLLKSDTYETPYDSLILYKRWDLGGLGNLPVSASLTVDSNNNNGFQPARLVMNTATSPEDSSQDISLLWEPDDPTWRYYVYMHFAEVVELPSNETREFLVLLNEKSMNMSAFSPRYLYTDTLYVAKLSPTAKQDGMVSFLKHSLAPSLSVSKRVQGIMIIKSKYGVKKNWLGDPCGPDNYPWMDISCSYVDKEPPRIVSVNLSFSGLTGPIDPAFSNLTSLEKLDLSNNSLTGKVPDFLANLYLTELNLEGNKLVGALPAKLLERSNDNSLVLRVGGNPDLCVSASCQDSKEKTKKKVYIIPLVGSIAGVFSLVIVTALLLMYKRGHRSGRSNGVRTGPLDTKRYYTYSEVVKVTSNFERELGQGGFGKVYHGILNEEQVAVKILSESSAQGYREFRAEVELLLRVHHKNLTALTGYCNAGKKMALIYEFMANHYKKTASKYGMKKNWLGDPCGPVNYPWKDINCSYVNNEPPRIVSLNLSFSGLTGEIDPTFSNLTSLKKLDLSNNSLTGKVPDFLGNLHNLTELNLEGNKLVGALPAKLQERSNNKSLVLRVGGNPDLCVSASCQNTSEQTKKNVHIIPLVASVAGVLGLVIAIALFLMYKKRNRSGGSNGVRTGPLDTTKRYYKYSEVVKITNNFERVLGQGGFGKVYHGFLNEEQVAVKILSESSTQGYREFRAEVELLLRVHHKNLTALIGYCNEAEKMALIYEFMANGTLGDYLSGKKSYVLSWEERIQISLDAAQGLEYLHSGCKPPIVQRDVKPANILINEKLQAKIADFGLSRSVALDGTNQSTTAVAGTIGYLDPEYQSMQQLSEKSDVYSFGVVLLEVLTGQPVILRSRATAENVHITDRVELLLSTGDIKDIVDPKLGERFDAGSAWKITEVAMACASRSSKNRPTMSQVVAELKESVSRARDGGGSGGSSVTEPVMTAGESGMFPQAR
ncbi:hypothetical protein F2Q69_00054927 [Brassica cretica]|uniref:non-specific serine/threonine protein kinase n=1 Tax=Brassica cretica TaxID=69181 RepID=A0A8S9N4M9_BRACR|nr:hypothetical protein F2Q69_00054927 [Brassica cretica]